MQKCHIKWVSDSDVVVSGIIDEFSTFDELFKADAKDIRIDFHGVTRINSSGIRTWMQAVMNYKGHLTLKRCSQVMVDQFSMIPDFMGSNSRVQSIMASYACESCKHETEKELVIGQDIGGDIPIEAALEIKCSQCGELAEIEQDADIYFAFLKG